MADDGKNPPEDRMEDETLPAQAENDPSSSSESEPSYSDYYSDDDEGGGGYYYSSGEDEADDNSPEANIRRFTEAIDTRSNRRRVEQEEREYVYHEDRFDFPKDPEKWREEDLRELWADGPLEATKPGWDPVWADEEDWEIVKDEVKAGRDPPIAPFYLPYRKHFPVIPDNHYDISNPRSVIEEMDRIEEFLKWVSFIFPDGSSYEGTVWDDYAHGKGVYVAEQGLVRYEGEWLQNDMEGHGVVEIDIPDVEPRSGSKLEAKMRAEGRIITRDFNTPEDKKWLEMDIEDSYRLAGNEREIPYYKRDEWLTVFGEKPETGRYRYAGQWKHGRMHGCGVYEVNERIIYGRFYFGEYVDDSTGCDDDVSAMHAGIAEVAAAKARMFVNKPDGMVREERGPYGDPQHPYFYEEDDVWMAPGFVNQFYDVPDYWKTYVEEVDQEREMWLNSFYKAPLRIPMPAELEYWWSQEQEPEFFLINKEPEPDPEDPSKLIYTEDPLIVHSPTGRLINFVEDDEHGVRLFWQPYLEDGEDVDPEKAAFLPLGFDEFYGRDVPGAKKETFLTRLMTAGENVLKPLLERMESWAEEKKKVSEVNQKLIEKELEFIEAEISLEETMEDMEIELKRKQKEEEKRAAAGKDSDQPSADAGEDEVEFGDGEDEEEDDRAPTSFGTVGQGEAKGTSDTNSRKPPFSSLSLSLPSCSLASMVPSKIRESILPRLSFQKILAHQERSHAVKFARTSFQPARLRAGAKGQQQGLCRRSNGLNPSARIKGSNTRLYKKTAHGGAPPYLNILSLHVPLDDFTLYHD